MSSPLEKLREQFGIAEPKETPEEWNDRRKREGREEAQRKVRETPLRPMPSWIEYGEMKIDTEKYLIGNGFLEPGGYVVLIGSS